MSAHESRSPIDVVRARTMLEASRLDVSAPAIVDAVQTRADLLGLVSPQSPCVVAEQVRDDGLPVGAALWCAAAIEVAQIQDPGWLPMVAALAASDAVEGIRVLIDWPATLVVQAAACGGAKGYGQLGSIEVSRPETGLAVVTVRIIGDISARDLPEAGTTSLLSEGADLDRTALLGRYLIALARRLQQWRNAPVQMQRDYSERCITLGRLTSDGRVVAGIDSAGELIVH